MNLCQPLILTFMSGPLSELPKFKYE